MTKGQIIKLGDDQVPYTIELIGPVTTLLRRDDGGLVQISTSWLRCILQNKPAEICGLFHPMQKNTCTKF